MMMATIGEDTDAGAASTAAAWSAMIVAGATVDAIGADGAGALGGDAPAAIRRKINVNSRLRKKRRMRMMRRRMRRRRSRRV